MTDFFNKAAADVEAVTDYADHITWKPQVGDILQGTLVAAKVGSTNRGDHPFILTVEELDGQGEPTGDTYTIWVGSSPFHLEQEITREAPMIDKLIYLTLVEEKQPKDEAKNPYKVFSVQAEVNDFDFWHKLLEQQRYQDGVGDVGPQDGRGEAKPVQQSHVGPDDAPF